MVTGEGLTDSRWVARSNRAFAAESIHHALERYTVQSNSDWMNGMREKAEPILQVGNRAVIADDVEFERSTSVHYCGLCKALSVIIIRSRHQLEIRNVTFSRIAPSLAEFSEYMMRVITTGSTGCIALGGTTFWRVSDRLG